MNALHMCRPRRYLQLGPPLLLQYLIHQAASALGRQVSVRHRRNDRYASSASAEQVTHAGITNFPAHLSALRQLQVRPVCDEVPATQLRVDNHDVPVLMLYIGPAQLVSPSGSLQRCLLASLAYLVYHLVCHGIPCDPRAGLLQHIVYEYSCKPEVRPLASPHTSGHTGRQSRAYSLHATSCMRGSMS
jgi:hypothetical protein